MKPEDRADPHPQWSADGDGRYVRNTGGVGEYGHVKIRIAPSSPGSGVLITKELLPGAIPEAFMPAVEQGLREAARRGIDDGFLVPDIRIDIVDGSYHDSDSSEAAFTAAAAMAFRDAVHNARRRSDTAGDDGTSSVTEPRPPKPAPRTSAVALPEPHDE